MTKRPEPSAETLGLYVHIPYCRTKCLYCDFNSHATQSTPWEAYLEALEVEIDAYQNHPFSSRALETVFFGGGTPSLFPPVFFDKLLQRIFARFRPGDALEMTMECNPGTVSAENLAGYRQVGINRLSFGVQSLNPVHLRTLTRIHGPEEALLAVRLAREAGFENVSIDLMFGVPGQTVEGWMSELHQALTLPLTHLSVYNLTPEEGTALVTQLERGRLFMPDEAVLVEMYQATRQALRAAAFVPYEISNFSRGRPCAHNLRYWRGLDTLGIGAGAFSYSREGWLPGQAQHTGAAPFGARWWIQKEPSVYLAKCRQGVLPLDGFEVLSSQEAATELVLVQGRTMEGIDLDSVAGRFGSRAREALESAGRPFVQRHLLDQRESRLALTDEGVLVADSLIQTLSLALDRVLTALPS